MAKLPIAPFEKILKESGAKRVAFSAAEALAEMAAEMAADIGKHAASLADHAGRKTVVRRDVEMAKKYLRVHV